MTIRGPRILVLVFLQYLAFTNISKAETIAVWTIWSPYYGVHMFSTNCQTIKSLMADPKWLAAVHVEFYIDNDASNGGVPLYQFSRPSGSPPGHETDRIWSTSEDAGGDKAYHSEGTLGYIYATKRTNTIAFLQIQDQKYALNHHFFAYKTDWDRYYKFGSRPDLKHGFNSPDGTVGYVSTVGTTPCHPYQVGIPSKTPKGSPPLPGCASNNCGNPPPTLPSPGTVTIPIPGG